ncbi:hypothetical protein Tco_1393980 [Tanacetum coccineum]
MNCHLPFDVKFFPNPTCHLVKGFLSDLLDCGSLAAFIRCEEHFQETLPEASVEEEGSVVATGNTGSNVSVGWRYGNEDSDGDEHCNSFQQQSNKLALLFLATIPAKTDLMFPSPVAVCLG